jgi:hypothetical protein
LANANASAPANQSCDDGGDTEFPVSEHGDITRWTWTCNGTNTQGAQGLLQPVQRIQDRIRW